jgi:hypothetical protein
MPKGFDEKPEVWAFAEFEEGPYYSLFQDKPSAIAQGLRDYPNGCYVGRVVDPRPLSQGLYADDLIEELQENLEEDWLVEGASFYPTTEQVKELEVMLRATLNAWFKIHNLEPKWFVVDQIEAITHGQEEP